MKPFTKLFNSIVTSSIWREPDHVRLVWITMLALADARGEVWASVGGLADAARVSRDQCLGALLVLSSPDPDSRTKDLEGRRIQEIDGGWILINYAKYRSYRDDENRRAQVREAVQRHRDKLKTVIKSNQSNQSNPNAEAEAENTVAAPPARPRTKRAKTLVQLLFDSHGWRFKGKHAHIKSALQAAIDQNGLESVTAACTDITDCWASDIPARMGFATTTPRQEPWIASEQPTAEGLAEARRIDAEEKAMGR